MCVSVEKRGQKSIEEKVKVSTKLFISTLKAEELAKLVLSSQLSLRLL